MNQAFRFGRRLGGSRGSCELWLRNRASWGISWRRPNGSNSLRERSSIGLRTYASESNQPVKGSNAAANGPSPSPKESSNGSSSLENYLIDTVKTTGPMTVSTFMRQCLVSPLGGYYVNRDPFGVSGDFTTSPEISQMFGELVGIWVLTQWMAQGCPGKCRIVEFGPGRGTLMNDLLRAGRSFKDFTRSIEEIYLVEASPTLREAQRELLCGSRQATETETGLKSTTKWGTPIYWVDVSKDIPQTPGVPIFLLAHEFFDALPIAQFEHTQSGWRELLVDYSVPRDDKLLPNETKITASEAAAAAASSDGSSQKPQFHRIVSPASTPSADIIPKTHTRYAKLPKGSRVEICSDAWEIAQDFSRIIESCGGAALIVDYGPSVTIPVDTLRGIRQHKLVSPFEAPGETDISADVDFQALKIAASRDRKVDVHGPVMQGDWLHAMGIGARATQLAGAQKTDDGKKRIEQAYNRLVEKSGGAMGKVYKIMSIQPLGTSIPVGFGGTVTDE